MTRPDMFIIAGFEGKTLNLEEIQYLPKELLEQTKKQIELMTHAALQDYQNIIRTDRLSYAVLDAVDKYHDRKQILEIIRQSDPADFSNSYLIAIGEFGATIGHLFNMMEGFGWLYSDPYFHSIIVHKETGFGITVFDWAVKKFSEYGVDDGYVAKIDAANKGIEDYQSKSNVD